MSGNGGTVMALRSRHEWVIRFACSALVGAVFGAVLGIASAQDRAPGQLDGACAAQCAENGNNAEFCGQVCWVPDPAVAARSYPVDWSCFTSCRERGGRAEDCLPACRKR